MVSKLFCDKCGKEIEGSRNRLDITKNVGALVNGLELRYDICIECTEEIIELLQPRE